MAYIKTVRTEDRKVYHKLIISNAEKARVCELYIQEVKLVDIVLITGINKSMVGNILSKCLFGVPMDENAICIVLQSKINEDENRGNDI